MNKFLLKLHALIALLIMLAVLWPSPASALIQRIAYGQDPAQFGELAMPDGKGPFPVAVLIHGGCWQASLPGLEQMRPLAEDLRDSGIAVWNIEYRRLGMAGAGYPGTFLDIADGMDMLRQLAPFNQLDLFHIVIVGHSAGGQLALWAAGRRGLPPDSPLNRTDPLPVQGVVTLAGIDDLADYRDNGPMACGGPITIDRLTGGKNRMDGKPYRDTSPVALLPLHTTQVIVSGSVDQIVPQHFGDDYAVKALTSGDKVNSLNIEGVGHFDMIDVQTAAWAQIKAHLLTMFN